jgi:RNA polymerase sigma-70 factor (ECF subfamily)
VDHARHRRRLKRGGGLRPLQLLVDPPQAESSEPIDILELDAAMEALARVSPRQAEVVTLKVYGGVTTETIAELLGVSARTVEGDWTFARAWLRREILKRRGDAPR